MALRNDYTQSDPLVHQLISSSFPPRQGNALLRGLADIQNNRVTTQVDATTITLANVTTLQINAVQGATYVAKYILHLNASAAGGARFDFDGGTATVHSMQATARLYTVTAVAVAGVTALATDLTVTAAAHIYGEIDVTFVVNVGGIIVPRFAQNTASGTSSILVNSAVLAVRIA